MTAKGPSCPGKGVSKPGSFWLRQQHPVGNREVSPMLAEFSSWGRPLWGPNAILLISLPPCSQRKGSCVPQNPPETRDYGQSGMVSGSVLRSCLKDMSSHFWLFQASVQEKTDFLISKHFNECFVLSKRHSRVRKHLTTTALACNLTSVLPNLTFHMGRSHPSAHPFTCRSLWRGNDFPAHLSLDLLS